MNELDIVQNITFYGFAFLIIVFAVATVLAKKILYALIFSIIVFFSAGGLFFSLNADYNAVVQIAIYGVAIPVLILFATTFTSYADNAKTHINYSPKFFIATLFSSLLFLVLWYIVEYSVHLNKNLLQFFVQRKIDNGDFNSVVQIANTLYVDYRLAFILLIVVLFITIVGISALNVIKEKNRG